MDSNKQEVGRVVELAFWIFPGDPRRRVPVGVTTPWGSRHGRAKIFTAKQWAKTPREDGRLVFFSEPGDLFFPSAVPRGSKNSNRERTRIREKPTHRISQSPT